MIGKHKIITLITFFTISTILFSNSFDEGERFFRGNKPAEAIPYFQKNLLESTQDPLVYTYLGIAYMQTGQNEKALETFKKGLTVPGTNKKVLYYNAGNVCFILQDFAAAKEYYTYAISADSLYSIAYLNRANTNLKLTNYQESIDDYTNYLALDPNSDQKANVEAMIAALKNELVYQKEEAARLAEEEARIKAEQEKQAAEQAEANRKAAAEQARLAEEQAAAEAARRKKLLEEVAAELQQTESTNLTAGTEGVIEYDEEESDLD